MSDLAALFRQAGLLARERLGLFVAAIVILTLLNVTLEFAPESAFLPLWILTLAAGIFLQAIVNASALGLDPFPTVGRLFLPLVGWAVIATVGLAVGLLLLVIPGLVLAARWSLGLPILLTEELGPYESLVRSWAYTRKRWSLAIAFPALLILDYLPFFLFKGFTADPKLPAPVMVALIFWSALLVAFQWVLGPAFYRHVRRDLPDSRLPHIFG